MTKKWIWTSIFLTVLSNTEAGVYGQRYCEIVYSKNLMDFYVYRSPQGSNCPHAWWSSLTKSKLAKKYHTKFVHLNGPRIWMVDDIHFKAQEHESEHIEGQKLHLVSSFHPNMKMLFSKHGPYVDYQLHRSQVYALKQGRRIIELISPESKIYVLQSLSLKFHHQTVKQVAHLKHDLKLPKGWSIKEGILPKSELLSGQDKSTHVIQDEFENTYQLSAKDLLT